MKEISFGYIDFKPEFVYVEMYDCYFEMTYSEYLEAIARFTKWWFLANFGD